MSVIKKLKEQILNGRMIEKEDALRLCDAPLDELCKAANEIREHFCNNDFDLCTIINGKSGRCSEDCKFCAQSSHYKTDVKQYPLLDTSELLPPAKYNAKKGILRYSIVTSGRALSDREIEQACQSASEIKKNVPIEVCASFGLVNREQLYKMKEAGISRIHCNLESSQNYFSNICTTHTYEEKIKTLKMAKSVGLSVCSGGIMGLGETMEDRIDMAISLRELGVRSVPINFLNPIPQTPYENNVPLSNEEKLRIVAIYRFLLPDASIRLAGGRGLIEDQGRACFQSGANAAISGDMLTTSGITIDKDREMIHDLGYQIKLFDC